MSQYSEIQPDFNNINYTHYSSINPKPQKVLIKRYPSIQPSPSTNHIITFKTYINKYDKYV